MANNDEYKLPELDALTPDTHAQEALEDVFVTKPTNKFSLGGLDSTRTKALIVVGIAFVLMVLYKVISSMTADVPKKVAMVPAPQRVATPFKDVQKTKISSATSTIQEQLGQKVSALELSEQNNRTDIETINTHLAGIQASIDDVSSKMTELSQSLAFVNAQIEAHAKIIASMKKRHAVSHHAKKSVMKYPRYYIQALIPGRAWLIANNGAMLTVRDGTRIAGYGTVRSIDPHQGRVVMSSGQVIRFSQDDS